MRTASVGMTAHIAGQLTTLSACFLIVRKDSVNMRFTNHDRALPISDGQFYDGTYRTGCAEQSNAIQVKIDMSVNNVDVKGFYIANDITELDILAGLYNNAPVYIFATNWKDKTQGIIKLLRGNMGQIRRQGEAFAIEFRSLAQQLQVNICSLVSATCRSNMGSTGTGSADGCRYPITPAVWQASHAYLQDFTNGGALTDVHPTTPNGYQYRCRASGNSGGSEPSWNTTPGGTTTDGGVTWKTIRAAKRTAVVTAITDEFTFTVNSILGDLTAGTGGSAAGGFFAPGVATFTSGPNNGFPFRVLSFEDAGSGHWEIVLKDPMIYAPVIGNTLTLEIDCDKAWETCKRLENYKNSRSEPKTPGNDAMYRVHPANGGKK